ncbi:MAG: S-layer homology domain-containing protein [bacterium]
MQATKKTIFTLTFIFLVAGCGPKPRTSESVLDNPEFHVSQGMKLLQRGDLNDAELSFQKALELDNRYTPAISGLALVKASRKDYKGAFKEADDAVELNKDSAFSWAVRARVKSLWRKDDNWANDANDDFKRALKLDPENEQYLFWYGQAKEWQYDFAGATEQFGRIIEKKGEYTARADQELALVQKILRAAPGSRLGMKIALLSEITRADLAVLFLEELKLREVFDRLGEKKYDTNYKPPTDPNESGESESFGVDVPTDVVGHWARTWIMQVIETGVMEPDADGKFYPDEKITRAEYALLLQNILITVMHDPDLATRYIGEESRFKDMRSGTATYNAAALAVDRGVMQATVEGTFDPMKTVSGADALLIIRQFQNHLRMTF